jgi:pimeloyl-ACP methyl ester carboxylesterase
MDIHQIRNAILVSNSFGCQVLTMLAAHRPELIHSLILLAPTMDPAVKSVVRVLARGIRDIPRERPGLWKVWIPDVVRTGPLRGLKTLRMALRDPQLDRLGAIQAPVIVVGGECDPIAPPAWIESMAGRFPNGRAIILPDAPHAMNYSRPCDIARVIRAVAGTGPGN